MSKAKATKADDVVHELLEIDVDRVDGVGKAASGLPFLLLKSVAAKPKLSPKARQAFRQNAERVRRGERPKAKRKRSRTARPSGIAAKAALSGEIPATNCVGEAASILAAVTGERSSGMCSARTMAGTPCQRPAVGGGRCHLHA